MRVLVTVVPGLGHLHPMVPLCRALVAAGHDVRLGVARRFAPVVEQLGLTAEVVGADWLESEADAYHPGFTSGIESQMQAFTSIPRHGLIDDLVQLADAWRPDVVVHDHTEFGGWIAAELLGIPNVPFAMTARIMDPAMLAVLVPEGVASLRAAYDLPADPELTAASRWLYLDSIPPSFAGSLFPPGPTVEPLRYGSDDRSGEEGVPVSVTADDTTPLVYVSLGTVFNGATGLLRTMIEGAASPGTRVVATTGRNVDPATLGWDLPSNVHLARYIPQVDLLPHCAAVVCHGGFNTVFGALSLGTPVVLVPLSADQPFNAFLCESSGVGRACTTEQPEGSLFAQARAEDVTPEQVAEALQTVLTDPSYRAAAQRIRDEIALQPPVTRGVELIEELVTTSR